MRICHRQKFPARFSGFPGVTLPALPVICHPVVGGGGAFAHDEEWLLFFVISLLNIDEKNPINLHSRKSIHAKFCHNGYSRKLIHAKYLKMPFTKIDPREN